MGRAENLGRDCYHLPPEDHERLRNSLVKKNEEEVKALKKQCELQRKEKAEEEGRILSEIERRGNPSEDLVRESWLKGWTQMPILMFCAAGEFFLAKWALQDFELGLVGTNFIAAMIVIMTLEGIDLYLTSLRRAHPEMENHTFLILGCLALILIFLFIFLTADLRQNVHRIRWILGIGGSPADIWRQAKEYEGNTRGIFIGLMASLGAAFSLVGGVGYHEAKNRIPFSWQLLKLYRKLRGVRTDMQRADQEMAALDARPSEFVAEFETGLAKEAIEQARKEKEAQNQPSPTPHPEPAVKKPGRYAPIFFSPLVMILIALILYFFVFRGTAHGAEHMVFFDLSKSVGAEDYTGKQTDFQKSTKAVEDFICNHVFPGDSLKVIAITEATFSRPFIMLDHSIGKDKGRFGERLARERMVLLESWKKLDPKPIAIASDVLGSLMLAAIGLAPGADKRHLVYFSDMRHTTGEINLERQKKINAETTAAKAEQLGLIPNLKGVKVWCLGVHTTGVTPEYWSSLREFWTKVFHRSGAQLVAFTMERRFQNE